MSLSFIAQDSITHLAAEEFCADGHEASVPTQRESSMNEFIRQNFPVYFPLFFLVMWIIVTTLLGVLSGWFVLMRAYPDRGEAPLQSFSWQSGSMNMVGMRSILRLLIRA
jgi:hypothetical protein